MGIKNRDLVEFMDFRHRIQNQFHALTFGISLAEMLIAVCWWNFDWKSGLQQEIRLRKGNCLNDNWSDSWPLSWQHFLILCRNEALLLVEIGNLARRGAPIERNYVPLLDAVRLSEFVPWYCWTIYLELNWLGHSALYSPISSSEKLNSKILSSVADRLRNCSVYRWSLTSLQSCTFAELIVVVLQ